MWQVWGQTSDCHFLVYLWKDTSWSFILLDKNSFYWFLDRACYKNLLILNWLYSHEVYIQKLATVCVWLFLILILLLFDSMNIFEWINDTSERQAAYHLNATSKVQQNWILTEPNSKMSSIADIHKQMLHVDTKPKCVQFCKGWHQEAGN